MFTNNLSVSMSNNKIHLDVYTEGVGKYYLKFKYNNFEYIKSFNLSVGWNNLDFHLSDFKYNNVDSFNNTISIKELIFYKDTNTVSETIYVSSIYFYQKIEEIGYSFTTPTDKQIAYNNNPYNNIVVNGSGKLKLINSTMSALFRGEIILNKAEKLTISGNYGPSKITNNLQNIPVIGINRSVNKSILFTGKITSSFLSIAGLGTVILSGDNSTVVSPEQIIIYVYPNTGQLTISGIFKNLKIVNDSSNPVLFSGKIQNTLEITGLGGLNFSGDNSVNLNTLITLNSDAGQLIISGKLSGVINNNSLTPILFKNSARIITFNGQINNYKGIIVDGKGLILNSGNNVGIGKITINIGSQLKISGDCSSDINNYYSVTGPTITFDNATDAIMSGSISTINNISEWVANTEYTETGKFIYNLNNLYKVIKKGNSGTMLSIKLYKTRNNAIGGDATKIATLIYVGSIPNTITVNGIGNLTLSGNGSKSEGTIVVNKGSGTLTLNNSYSNSITNNSSNPVIYI